MKTTFDNVHLHETRISVKSRLTLVNLSTCVFAHLFVDSCSVCLAEDRTGCPISTDQHKMIPIQTLRRTATVTEQTILPLTASSSLFVHALDYQALVSHFIDGEQSLSPLLPAEYQPLTREITLERKCPGRKNRQRRSMLVALRDNCHWTERYPCGYISQ